MIAEYIASMDMYFLRIHLSSLSCSIRIFAIPKKFEPNYSFVHFLEFSNCTSVIKAPTPCDRTSRATKYKNVARSRLFVRIVTRAWESLMILFRLQN